MKINVVMPQLGESVTEGEVLRWLKRAGEPVQRDEALVEVKTDKATVEIPAPATGTLSEILIPEGGKVAVGAGIATLESTSEAAALAVEGASTGARLVEPPVARLKSAPPKPAARPEPAVEKPPKPQTVVEQPPKPEAAVEKPPQPQPVAEKPARKPTRVPGPVRTPPPPPPPAPTGARVRMTPLARRVAAELGADPSKIAGTGEGGRVTREDVLRAQAPQQGQRLPAAGQAGSIAKPEATPEAEPAPATTAARSAPSGVEGPKAARSTAEGATAPQQCEAHATGQGAEDEAVALSPIRRRIAARLVQSSQTIPHVTTAIEADMTPVAELRKRHREPYEKAGIKLSYMPFIMKAVVDALKEFRTVNASWGGDKLILHRRVHLGMAVSVEGGLVVPVIRNADSMSVRRLAGRLAEVAEHARSGKLAADEVQGSTFTITNPGLFGTVFSTPIINPPEAAILAVCRIAEAPVVWNGQIAARLMTHLCLSYDHRIIDGETAIKFLQHLRESLEAAKFDME